ncbi:CvpA family protein [Neisseria sp. Marseille-Q6792]|uniref:CvpA family protein n=1 Tax=Neisseria sp. Marseille-Q6792 TaxID=2937985 RepID=UPI002024759A|nr:CvpA family protein [Neisseria sp. Marseille-Q6792]
MNSLPIADLLVSAVIAACIVLSAMRGVIAEAGSMVAWVVAFFFAKLFAASFADIAFASFQPRLFALALSFISLFVIACLIQKILRSLLTQAVSSVGLGFANRILGGVFGALKGVLIVTLLVMLASKTDLPDTEEWRRSYTVPFFVSLSETVLNHADDSDGALEGD